MIGYDVCLLFADGRVIDVQRMHAEGDKEAREAGRQLARRAPVVEIWHDSRRVARLSGSPIARTAA